MASTFGLILAGGAGRRMGGADGTGADKALLMLDGRPLVDHAIRRLAPQVQTLAISANGVAARLAFTGCAILPDAVPGRGPLEGVLAGLIWARGAGADWLASVAVDSPGFPTDLVARLAAPGTLAHARCDGRDHPTFALWPVALAPRLQAALDGGARRMMAVLADLGGQAVELPDGSIRNLNTPDDLEKARAR